MITISGNSIPRSVTVALVLFGCALVAAGDQDELICRCHGTDDATIAAGIGIDLESNRKIPAFDGKCVWIGDKLKKDFNDSSVRPVTEIPCGL